MSLNSNALASCLVLFCISIPDAAFAMNKRQCTAAKWAVLGFTDLLEGYDNDKFNDRKSDCEKKNIVVDVNAYRHGEALAIPIYCSTTFGLAYGSYGFDYNGFCPPEFEQKFLSAYAIGEQYYPAVHDVERAQSNLEASQTLLDGAINRYNRAIATMNDPKSTPEERSKAAKSTQKSSKDIRTWQSSVARDQSALTYALENLFAAETVRENRINAAGLFPEGVHYDRDIYTVKFESDETAYGEIKKMEDDATKIIVTFMEPFASAPIENAEFQLDAISPYEFISRGEVEDSRSCRVTRRTRRSLRTLARKQKGKAVFSETTSISFFPPTDTKRYSLANNPPFANGVLRTDDRETLGEKFVSAGLASEPGGRASSEWYRNPECSP